MNSVSQNYTEEKRFYAGINHFFKRFRFSQSLQKANAYKHKGVPVIDVFQYLFKLVFNCRSMYMDMLNGRSTAKFGKDTVYRFLNSVYINWQTFLLSLSSYVINHHFDNLTAEDRIKVFIVDDTFFGRIRSKCVEMLSVVHDHTDGKYKKGFRLLTLGWSDGNSFVPLNFCHLASEHVEKHIYRMKEDINRATNGFKRRIQAMTKGPEVMLQMLAQAIKQKIPARHVLFDSWFSAPATIIRIIKLRLHVISRLKNTPKIFYIFNGNKMKLKDIYDSQKKRRGRSKYLLSVTVGIYDKAEKVYNVRIVFVRDRNNSRKWIAILSTDLELTEEQIIQTYGKRWDIEVFFKMCKSYLSLGKEFQGLSYDMLAAHTAIVYSRYIMLSVENRNEKDVRTLGELFFLFFDEIHDIQFTEVLKLMLELIAETLQDCLFLEKKQINAFLELFISKLPCHTRNRLKQQESA